MTDEQTSVLTLLQRRSADSPTFAVNIAEIQKIEKTKQIIVAQDHMNKFKQLRELSLTRKKTKKTAPNDLTNEPNVPNQRRSLEWTLIFDGYIRQSNDYCVFIYDRHHFTKRERIRDTAQFFMSVDGHCKVDTCTCRFHGVLSENGRLQASYFGKIEHETDDTHARPIRGSRREELQRFTTLGATPGALYIQQLKSMSDANKEAGNRNNVGSSPSVMRKISSEGNIKYRRDSDVEKSLHELKIEQAKKIFPGEAIPGYIQEISTDPLRLICFTADGIATYHQFAPRMPLSWDATGSIVINRVKRIYYYELTMSNISKGGPSFPITVMLSASHGTMDIVHWMNCFIEKYKQAYGFTKPFPKPPVIHSDRALVFLIAGIQIFNGDETMDRYIERCWRIVQRTATKRDLELTVVHACLGHLMKNVKRNACKDLGKKQVRIRERYSCLFSFIPRHNLPLFLLPLLCLSPGTQMLPSYDLNIQWDLFLIHRYPSACGWSLFSSTATRWKK
jgi:hypothetical protein